MTESIVIAPTEPRESGRKSTAAWQRALWPFALVALGLVAFAPAFFGGFVDWDDAELIRNNPLLQAGSGWVFLQTWARPYEGLYAPLTYTLYAGIAVISRAITGTLTPGYFHVAGILFHVVGGLLIWLLLKSLAQRDVPAFAGAAIWLIHPIQVEAVAWVSGFNTVVSGVFAIAALWIEVESVQAENIRRRNVLFGVSCLLALLSWFSKPACLLLPPAMWAINTFILRQPWKKTWPRVLTWAVLALPFAIVGQAAQRSGMIEIPPPLLSRFLVAAHAFGFYALKIVWPHAFAIDYGLTPDFVLAHPLALALSGIALAAVVAAIALRRRQPWIAGALLVFLAGVLPVLGLVQFYFQSYSTVADRYVYFSMTGTAIVVAHVIAPWADRRWMQIGVAAVLLLLASLTFQQSRVWHDSRSLVENAFAVNPSSVAANGALGTMAVREGNDAFAEKCYRQVLQLHPWDSDLRFYFANLLLRTKRPAEAAENYLIIVRDPYINRETAYNNLGFAYVTLGKPLDALHAFESATRENPKFADAYANAGAIYLHLNDPTHARALAEHALSLNPNQPQALHCLAELNAAKH